MNQSIVDAHTHLWDLTHHYYPWLQDRVHEMWIGDYSSIRRDYLVEDYLKDTKNQRVVQSVHLQAMFDPKDPVGETRWLQACAARTGFPHAIVGFANFEEQDIERTLDAHAQFANLRGIRMDLNWHVNPLYRFAEAPDIMTRPRWRAGFAHLRKYQLSFDLQIYAAYQAEDAARLVDEYSDVLFIMDHAGAPMDRSVEGIEAWRRGLRLLAARSNVVTKVSGFDMFDHQWTAASIRPRVLDVIEIFGIQRCLFASNFPVSSLYGSYDRLVAAYTEILSGASATELAQFFHDNAVKFYRLNPSLA